MNPDKLLSDEDEALAAAVACEDEALAAALEASMSEMTVAEMTVAEMTEADEEDEREAGVSCERSAYWREMLHPSADHMKFARQVQKERLQEALCGPPQITWGRLLKEPTLEKYDAIVGPAWCDGEVQKAAPAKGDNKTGVFGDSIKMNIEARNDFPLQVEGPTVLLTASSREERDLLARIKKSLDRIMKK